MVFRKHDEVYLSNENFWVGAGTLRKVSADDFVHGTRLGDLRVGVMIDEVFDDDALLPFPVVGSSILADAKSNEVCVIFNRADICLMEGTKPPVFQKVSSAVLMDSLETLADPPKYESHTAQVHSENFTVELPNVDDKLEATATNRHLIVEDLQDISGDQSLDARFLHIDDTVFWPTEEGEDDNDVSLFLSMCEVAQGIVHHVDHNKFCHNVLIGIKNVSVRILLVEEGHEEDPLPFPHSGAETLGEAVGTPVRWEKSDLCKATSPCLNTVSRRLGTTEDFSEDSDSPANVSSKGKNPICDESVDYSQRRNWTMKDVQMYCPDRRVVVGEGVILANLPTHIVDEKEVGEDHVGVTLTIVHIVSYFPEFPSGDVQTVAWPIHSVKLVKDGRFLGDLMKETADDSDEFFQVIEDLPTQTTWGYHSTKRRKVDLEAAKIKRRETKKVSKLEDEEIQKSRLTYCCDPSFAACNVVITLHLQSQMSRRHLYYGARIIAKAQPQFIYARSLTESHCGRSNCGLSNVQLEIRSCGELGSSSRFNQEVARPDGDWLNWSVVWEENRKPK